MTPAELKEISAELATRIGVRPTALTLSDAIAAAANEGHVVDVRLQPEAVGASATWSVRFHPTADLVHGISWSAETWEEAFARTFRQRDDLVTMAASEDRQRNRNQG